MCESEISTTAAMHHQINTFDSLRTSFMTALKESVSCGCMESVYYVYSTSKALESEKKSILEHVLREYMITLLEQPLQDIATYESYITLCILVCRQHKCSALLPVILLGDVFDAFTLDQCEKLFTFVENNVNVWKEDLFFGSCKNSLLRMCNDLLRRLSRSQNTVFCGRIQLFLSKFFPFSERSGLNVVSEFNLENVTEYGGDSDKVLEPGDEPMNVDKPPDPRLKIDYNLYCKFWALQDFFRNPNQCYNKLQWRTFTAHTGDVLSSFSSYKLEDMPAVSNSRDSENSQNGVDNRPPEQQYFAKFLTNQKLLELQLSDSNFRRYVLVQFLILFQYLGSNVKFRADTDKLKTEQTDWVNDTSKIIYALIEETPPDGAGFATTVRHILQREEYWNSWKNEGCPAFKKPYDSSELEGPTPPKRIAIGEQMQEAHSQGRYILGTPELTKLWNLSSNNLEACRSKGRDFLPSLEEYFEEAIQQSDPANMIEEKYKRVNDGNFGWRALRLLARRSPHFFTHSNNPIHKLPEYLEMMIKRIAKDLPTTVVPEEALKPEILEEDLAQGGQEHDEEELMPVEVKKGPADPDDVVLTRTTIRTVAVALGSDWTRLAIKLGYKDDEIEYLQSGHGSDTDRAVHLLENWQQDDKNACVGSLATTLSELGHKEVARMLL